MYSLAPYEKILLFLCRTKPAGILYREILQELSSYDALVPKRDAAASGRYVRKVTRQALRALFEKGLVDFIFPYKEHLYFASRKSSRSLIEELSETLQDERAAEGLHEDFLVTASLQPISQKAKKLIKSRNLIGHDGFMAFKRKELESLRAVGLPSPKAPIERIVLTDKGIEVSGQLWRALTDLAKSGREHVAAPEDMDEAKEDELIDRVLAASPAIGFLFMRWIQP